MKKLYIFIALLLLFPCCAFAEDGAPDLDTDGVLKPGEEKSFDIDYDKAQRQGEERGDERFENPTNDHAAATDRALKREARAQYSGTHSRSERDKIDGSSRQLRSNQNGSMWH